ncbi:response regulator transcription factor [Planomonospora sp. ID82291]|uniref:response regulator transcription factor n=1 Tax=Planomonospora sp. ID82291 TaxID=2738136 RepID=UPI0018C394CB|nr:response regulator transcription factor [Planomonospora sp. ID82291]MBG0815461.1 response regulator transcription factor [Planomonospora sp. ID82291]
MAGVLVVDDDPDVKFVVSLVLKRSGHDVVTAGTGQAALEIAAREMPDAVILDWVMPGLFGPEVCRRLRAMPGGDRVAVMMLTVRVGEGDMEAAFRAGADDYMIKPFGHEEFVARVEGMLARAARPGSDPDRWP